MNFIYMNYDYQLEQRGDLNIVAISFERNFAVILPIEISIALIQQLVETLVNSIEIWKNQDRPWFYTAYDLIYHIECSFGASIVWKLPSNKGFNSLLVHL